jgi:hypothetical protein
MCIKSAYIRPRCASTPVVRQLGCFRSISTLETTNMNNPKDDLRRGFEIQIGMECLEQACQISHDARIMRWISLFLKVLSAGFIFYGCMSVMSDSVPQGALTAVLGGASTVYSWKLSAEAHEQLEKAHQRLHKIVDEIYPNAPS